MLNPLVTAAGKYDRRAILALAWRSYWKHLDEDRRLEGAKFSCRRSWAYALKCAWAIARSHLAAWQAENGRTRAFFMTRDGALIPAPETLPATAPAVAVPLLIAAE